MVDKPSNGETNQEHAVAEGMTGRQATLAGGAAGLFTRMIIAPFDVVKIRLQLNSLADSTNPSHMKQLIQTIWQKEGFRGFWKGNIPAQLLYISYGASQFYTYNAAKAIFSRATNNREAVNFCSGAMAGSAGTICTYPLDLLRTRFAAQGTDKIYSSFLRGLTSTIRQEGFFGLYRGSSLAVLQIAPHMGILFTTYEACLQTLRKSDLCEEGSAAFSSGLVSGFFAKAVMYPFDTVRKRLQVQGPHRQRYIVKNIPEYRGIFDCVRIIMRTEGVRGFYRGIIPSIMKAGPSSAITLWAFDESLRIIKKSGL